MAWSSTCRRRLLRVVEGSIRSVAPSQRLFSRSLSAGLQRFLPVESGSFGLQGHHILYRYVSTLRDHVLSSVSNEGAVQPSPLTMVPTLIGGTKKDSGQVDRTRPVQAVLKKIKESPKKVNLVAALVRGMQVEDALLQLEVLQKRAAKTVKKVVANARANATHNHGLDGNRLYVGTSMSPAASILSIIMYG